jgi:glucosamine kinase
MLLIADSGATKTAWRYVAANGSITQFQTVGFNPLLESEDSIQRTIRQEIFAKVPSQTLTNVFFYGAGCGTASQANHMKNVLQKCFEAAQIAVFDDMLGAARSLCNKKTGLVGILGTGSNACLYDGQNIVSTKGGLGLQLGDEGSGAYLGRQLIMDFLNEEMPPHLATIFGQRYALEKANIFEAVYAKPYPNRYLAQFAKFLFDHRQDFYCDKVVYEAMLLFFDKTICKYPNYSQYQVHFTGSVAFWFSSILQRAAQTRGATLGIVSENPMAGLLLYHE